MCACVCVCATVVVRESVVVVVRVSVKVVVRVSVAFLLDVSRLLSGHGMVSIGIKAALGTETSQHDIHREGYT